MQLHAELQALPDDDSDIGDRRSGTPSRRRKTEAPAGALFDASNLSLRDCMLAHLIQTKLLLVLAGTEVEGSEAEDSETAVMDETTAHAVNDTLVADSAASIEAGGYKEAIASDDGEDPESADSAPADSAAGTSVVLEGTPNIQGAFSSQDPGKGGHVGYADVPTRDALGKMSTWQDWGKVMEPGKGGQKPEKAEKVLVNGREWELGMPLDDPDMAVRTYTTLF